MFWFVVIGAIILDHVTKLIVSSMMFLGQEIPVLGKLFSLTYVVNYGAAYNILDGNRYLLIFVTVSMLGLLFWYYRTHVSDFSKLEVLSFAMIAGGGIGNIISRVFIGYVVDFLDIHIIPIFNVADIFICCGCGLLLAIEFNVFGLGEKQKNNPVFSEEEKKQDE